jgi:hypothetical protein
MNDEINLLLVCLLYLFWQGQETDLDLILFQQGFDDFCTDIFQKKCFARQKSGSEVLILLPNKI